LNDGPFVVIGYVQGLPGLFHHHLLHLLLHLGGVEVAAAWPAAAKHPAPTGTAAARTTRATRATWTAEVTLRQQNAGGKAQGTDQPAKT